MCSSSVSSLVGEVVRLSFSARNIPTRPTPSAPRRALVPGEHCFIVHVLRARRMAGHSLLLSRQLTATHTDILQQWCWPIVFRTSASPRPQPWLYPFHSHRLPCTSRPAHWLHS